MPDETGKSKLIIDEDWKSQVEAEKAAAAQKREEKPAGAEAPAGESADNSAEASANPSAAAEPGAQPGAQPGAEALPPPSLSSLVITLATQAMAAMGLMAGPDGKPLPVELDHAKYLIDTIAMLETKTAGNRSAEESALFEDALHQLRMTFVSVGKGT